jgi:hypothetical protein
MEPFRSSLFKPDFPGIRVAAWGAPSDEVRFEGCAKRRSHAPLARTIVLP